MEVKRYESVLNTHVQENTEASDNEQRILGSYRLNTRDIINSTSLFYLSSNFKSNPDF